MAKGEEAEALQPTPEQVQGFEQRIRAAMAMAAFNKYCSGLNSKEVYNHPIHGGCIQMPALASDLLLLDLGSAVGIGVPQHLAEWMTYWPYEAVVATQRELIFVSKQFEWMQTKIAKIGVSTGDISSNLLLSRLCNQDSVNFYKVDNPRAIHSVQPLMPGIDVKVFKSLENVPILRTRDVYESRMHAAKDDSLTRAERHFSS